MTTSFSDNIVWTIIELPKVLLVSDFSYILKVPLKGRCRKILIKFIIIKVNFFSLNQIRQSFLHQTWRGCCINSESCWLKEANFNVYINILSISNPIESNPYLYFMKFQSNLIEHPIKWLKNGWKKQSILISIFHQFPIQSYIEHPMKMWWTIKI